MRHGYGFAMTIHSIHSATLAGISTDLSASAYATEQITRVIGEGFRWKENALVLSKIDEEIAELRVELVKGDHQRATMELGDLLHAVHTLAVNCGTNAQTLLDTTKPAASDTLSLDAQRDTLAQAIASADNEQIREQAGLFLHAIHGEAHRHGIDPEEALRSTNREFQRRFTNIERKLHGREGTTVRAEIGRIGVKSFVKNYWKAEKPSAQSCARA
jgi:uncharacterized protein YabN with tetrapyrrole methylase and pyrophosphatase domain